MDNWWSGLSRRQANVVVGVAALMVVVVLVLLAVQLRGTQTSERRHLSARFHDRAQVISALTEALLGSAAASTDATRQYRSAQVSVRVMDEAVRQGHLAYAVLLDQHRRVIAASRSLSPTERANVLSSPAVGRVLAGAPLMFSDVEDTGGSAKVDFALSVNAPAGRRVLVNGAPTALLSSFLGSYLRRVPTPEGSAYIVDSRGDVVGAREAGRVAGRPVDVGLLRALQRRSSGSYGDAGYFSAVAVPGSRWRVVLTSKKSSLFSAVSGSRAWLPWIIYLALAIAALGFLTLMRRLLGSAAALSTANEGLASSNARLESSNALLRHAAELSRSNAELEQFASIASHDLQEPLRKVQTFAAQLNATEHERLSEQGQDFLRRMSDAAGRMRSLIDDLLMFSRVSTKGRPFVPVDLNEIAAQVLIDLEQSIEDSGARVTIDSLPTVEADPVQMRQLLQNLLGNALKFRREDVVPELEVSVRADHDLAQLTFRDNGIGFDPQYATRIFRAFERLHGAHTYPGTGMGLALCRRIVERHNGTIHADSELDRGTTLTVRLPVDQPADGTQDASLFPDTSEREAHHAFG